MPVTCKKHFCGSTVVQARGAVKRPGLWPAWGAASHTGAGVHAAAGTTELPAVWFPTWLLEQFSRIKCQKSFILEELITFFRTGGSSLTLPDIRPQGGYRRWCFHHRHRITDVGANATCPERKVWLNEGSSGGDDSKSSPGTPTAL